MNEDQIAQFTHEMNKAWCECNGDFSQTSWTKAPEWQRSSAIAGVSFRLRNPNAPPSAMHDSWMDQKITDGWVFGEVKDADKKTHPCMVPFDQLPAEQQFKDKLFSLIVDTLKEKERG
jgi:hypothetical protein